MTDPRIEELEQLAASEGIALPLSPSLIIGMEERGYIVNLLTGAIVRPVAVGAPTPSGRAVAYLLADVVGEFAL